MLLHEVWIEILFSKTVGYCTALHKAPPVKIKTPSHKLQIKMCRAVHLLGLDLLAKWWRLLMPSGRPQSANSPRLHGWRLTDGGDPAGAIRTSLISTI